MSNKLKVSKCEHEWIFGRNTPSKMCGKCGAYVDMSIPVPEVSTCCGAKIWECVTGAYGSGKEYLACSKCHKRIEGCACGDHDIPNATHTKLKCETPKKYMYGQTSGNPIQFSAPTPKKERKIKGWVLTNALLTIPEQTGSFLDSTVWLKKPPKFSAIYTEITITYK